MSVWSWVKLTIALWLIRKAFKAAGWLLLAAVAVAAWPLTLTAALGYAAAWLRGWPPARLGRTAAATAPVTAAWLLLLATRTPGQATAQTPARAWETSWARPVTADLARTFLLLAPPPRSRPGSGWPRCCGRGGSTPSPPAWPATPRPRRSPSRPANGNTRSAPPAG